MQLLFLLVAVAVGVMIAVQPALNSRLAVAAGHPYFGALTNFTVGFLALAAIGLIVLRPTLPTKAMLASAPWWAWCGGLLGATFVTLAILLLPKLGAVLMIGAILVGQLIAAAAIDRFGLLGVRQQHLTPTRIAGIGVLVVGLVLVQMGTPKQAKAGPELTPGAEPEIESEGP